VAFDDFAPAGLSAPPETAAEGLGARSLAAAVDLLVLLALLFAEAFVLVGVFGMKAGRDLGAGDLPYFLIALAVAWLYCAGFDSGRRGASPGKRLLGLEVVDLRGERLGFARASLRFVLRGATAASFLLGWLMIGLNRRKQALHDLLSGSLVIRSAAKPA